jgi:hypothetical protein
VAPAADVQFACPFFSLQNSAKKIFPKGTKTQIPDQNFQQPIEFEIQIFQSQSKWPNFLGPKTIKAKRNGYIFFIPNTKNYFF